MPTAEFLRWLQTALPFFGRSVDNIIPDQIWISDISIAMNYRWLKDNGITHIVSVLNFPRDEVQLYPNDFKYYYANRSDNTSTCLQDIWPSTCAFIDDALQHGGRVLVHCKFGRSRSVATVAAYMIYKLRMLPSQALDWIRQRREQASPNRYFIFQLYDWARDFQGRCHVRN